MGRKHLDQIIWTFIFSALAGLCAWNIIQNRSLRARLAGEHQGGDVAVPEFQASLHHSLKYAGSFLKWPDRIEALGAQISEIDEDNPLPKNYFLLLAFSELSCDLCRDQETQFALAVADRVGEDRVVIVAHARTERYIRSYIRMNGIHLPVWADLEGAFFTLNGIDETPVLLLCNERREVIAAHYPLPERPELSEPFHRFCLSFLDSNTAHAQRAESEGY